MLSSHLSGCSFSSSLAISSSWTPPLNNGELRGSGLNPLFYPHTPLPWVTHGFKCHLSSANSQVHLPSLDLVPELNIQIASHLPDGPRCPRGTSHLRCETLNPEPCCSHQLSSAENGPSGLPAAPSKTFTPFLLSHPTFKPLANPISTTFKIDAEGHHLPSFPQPPPWPQGTVTSLLDHCHGL